MRVVRLRRNFGKAAALAAGFAHARGDVVVTIDGDLQDDPAEIPRLLAKLDEGFDLVSGWKTRRRDPWTRRVPSRGLQPGDRPAVGRPPARLQLRTQGVPRRGRARARIYGELHRFIPVLAHHRGFRVAELPVNHRPREHGRSRYGLERYLRGFLDLLDASRSWAATGTGRSTSSAASAWSSARSASAILVYLTVVKLLGHAIGKRPLLTLGVLLVVVGHPVLLARADQRARSPPSTRSATGDREHEAQHVEEILG